MSSKTLFLPLDRGLISCRESPILNREVSVKARAS